MPIILKQKAKVQSLKHNANHFQLTHSTAFHSQRPFCFSAKAHCIYDSSANTSAVSNISVNTAYDLWMVLTINTFTIHIYIYISVYQRKFSGKLPIYELLGSLTGKVVLAVVVLVVKVVLAVVVLA